MSVFIKAAEGGGGPCYTSRAAALRSNYIEQALISGSASGGGGGLYGDASSGITEVVVPGVHGAALVAVMEHCERVEKAAHTGGEATAAAEQADRDLVANLDAEALLRLVGAAHRLVVPSVLALASARVAAEIAQATSQKHAPWDELIGYVEPGQTLSEAERQVAPFEYIFTNPEVDPDEHLVAAAAVAQAEAAAAEAASAAAAAAALGASVPAVAKKSSGSGSMASLMCMGTPSAAPATVPAPVTAPPALTEAERLIALIGSEAALQACLERIGTRALQQLKPRSRVWRRRARTALCSGTWRELLLMGDVVDLGITRHWTEEERCEAAKFLSDGGCARVTTLRADGFEAHLPPLLQLTKVDGVRLLQAIVVNPSAGGASFEAMTAQNEFLGYVALWLLGSSTVLGEAEFSALAYSGLLPLQPALAPAVERGGHAALHTLTLSKCALPIRTLVGRPLPPPAPSTPLDVLDLKWQRVGAIDARLVAKLLQHNWTLTKVDLSWNSDLSSGALALAAAIASSRTLRDVDLAETSLGDACTEYFCRAITDNRSLARLSLRCCGIPPESRAALEKAAGRRAQPLELVL